MWGYSWAIVAVVIPDSVFPVIVDMVRTVSPLLGQDIGLITNRTSTKLLLRSRLYTAPQLLFVDACGPSISKQVA